MNRAGVTRKRTGFLLFTSQADGLTAGRLLSPGSPVAISQPDKTITLLQLQTVAQLYFFQFLSVLFVSLTLFRRVSKRVSL